RDSFSVYDIPPGEFYLTHMEDGVRGVTPTSDQIGYLRITRTGSYATGYYLNGSQWIQIHTGPVTTFDVGFGFAAWSDDNLFSQQTEKSGLRQLHVEPRHPTLPHANPEPGVGTCRYQGYTARIRVSHTTGILHWSVNC